MQSAVTLCDYLLSSEPPDSQESLLQISEGLQKFTKFTSFRELATLTYGDQTSNCCIVSSIEFDRDGEFFAVAGVTKKIKVTCCLSVAQFTVCCYAVHRLLCIPSCASRHVHPVMCIPSCASHHVHPVMCIPSCASRHVHPVMCRCLSTRVW